MYAVKERVSIVDIALITGQVTRKFQLFQKRRRPFLYFHGKDGITVFVWLWNESESAESARRETNKKTSGIPQLFTWTLACTCLKRIMNANESMIERERPHVFFFLSLCLVLFSVQYYLCQYYCRVL